MSGNGREPKGVRTWIHLGANRRREPPRVDALKRFVTALRHYREWSPALDSELGLGYFHLREAGALGSQRPRRSLPGSKAFLLLTSSSSGDFWFPLHLSLLLKMSMEARFSFPYVTRGSEG